MRLARRCALQLLPLLACLFAALATPAHAARRVALLIGNQAYAHERPLTNPANDAALLGRVLRDDLKFDLVRVERNLGLAAMDRVIDQFLADARGADTVVFYFSGHGLTWNGVDDDTRGPYLLPVDARTGPADAPRLDRQAVAVKSLRNRLQSLGAPVTLLFLDACRDGPGLGKSGSKGLARVGGGPRLLLSYATEDGQVAEDGRGANSPYAAALAQAWRQPQWTVLEQLDHVYDEVTRQHPQQRPLYEDNVRASTRLSPYVPQDSKVEDEAWALCRQAASRVPCDDYLATWPKGRYGALARTRINSLAADVQRPVNVPQQPSTPAAGTGYAACKPIPEGAKPDDFALGRLNVLSALGEPIRAEIELSRIGSRALSSAAVRVAPLEAYRTANADYNSALVGATLRLAMGPDGRCRIVIEGTAKVNPPFVELIVEATWDGGRIVREFTLLFDAPARRR